MFRVKKIHKLIILLFIIFIIGVYVLTLYIGYTIDHHNPPKTTLTNDIVKPSSQVTEID